MGYKNYVVITIIASKQYNTRSIYNRSVITAAKCFMNLNLFDMVLVFICVMFVIF